MNELNMTPDGRLSNEDSATYLGKTRSALDQDRYLKRGPRYCKLDGRVWYFKNDLDAYIRSCMVDPQTEAAAR